MTTDVAEFVSRFRKAARTHEAAERLKLLRQAAALYTGELLPGFYDDWVLAEQRRLAELYMQVERLLRAADLKAGTVTAEVSALPETEAAPAPLPVSCTRFFGREEELARLQEWLSPHSEMSPKPRLITITGAGGTGKTRLSLEIACRLVAVYSGSVWFVPLADLRDPNLIGSSLVEALSLPRSGNIEPREQAIGFLRELGKPALLVLDNFEQLVEEGAEIVQTLLEQIPTLTVLMTSRRLLNLSSEREFVLLPLPTPQEAEPFERLSLYESVRLFVDRAQQVRPDFQMTARNAAAVAELCQKLEGVPLAIELAAARVQVLTPSQMLALMERRFDFLVSRKRDVSGRHQSLWAALDWSYRLLSPELQRFFARLSVFRGGWTLEAAEAVCQEPQALEYLEQLREWSLILAYETDAGMRFHMLETLREYGWVQLAAEECARLRQRHLDYFVRLSQIPERGLGGEEDNLRACLEWAKAVGGVEAGYKLMVSTGAFGWYGGRWQEGRAHYNDLFAKDEADEPSLWRGRALAEAALLSLFQGDYQQVDNLSRKCLQISAQMGDKKLRSWILEIMGNAANQQGHYDQAQEWLEESLAIAREIGEGIGVRLNDLALVHMSRGDFARARQLLEESRAAGLTPAISNLAEIAQYEGDLKTARALADESIERWGGWGAENIRVPSMHCRFGQIARLEGDYAQAAEHFYQSLTLCWKIGDRPVMVEVFRSMAELAADLGQGERAAHLFGAEEALRESLKSVLHPYELAPYEQEVEKARSCLDEAAFRAAWEAGRAMTWEQAVAYAL
ncbi:MAG TPA: tetratricopeptide repeat protein [Chthonomonadaceae bacterium]|nr:tetratricopeptide repeat protein [Chthonomonadaceae bacterium]